MTEYARKGVNLEPRSQLTRGSMAHSHYVLRERKAFLREMEATLELNPGSPYSTTLAVDQGPRLPFIALGTSTQASTWPSSRKQDFRRKDVTFV